MTAKKKSKVKPAPALETKGSLEDVARCFERWATVIRKAAPGDVAEGLGSVQLSYTRSKPGMVAVVVHGAKNAAGFRGDIRAVLALQDEEERKQYADEPDLAPGRTPT